MPCHDSAVHNAGFMDVVASHVDFVLAAIRLLYADCTVPLIGPLAIPSAVGVHALALALKFCDCMRPMADHAAHASQPPAPGVQEEPRGRSCKRCDYLKWMSLTLLVVQNSVLFLTMRYTTVAHPNDHYHSTVVVVVIELSKLVTCYIALGVRTGYPSPRMALFGPMSDLLQDRRALRELCLPALCYTVGRTRRLRTIARAVPSCHGLML